MVAFGAARDPKVTCPSHETFWMTCPEKKALPCGVWLTGVVAKKAKVLRSSLAGLLALAMLEDMQLYEYTKIGKDMEKRFVAWRIHENPLNPKMKPTANMVLVLGMPRQPRPSLTETAAERSPPPEVDRSRGAKEGDAKPGRWRRVGRSVGQFWGVTEWAKSHLVDSFFHRFSEFLFLFFLQKFMAK